MKKYFIIILCLITTCIAKAQARKDTAYKSASRIYKPWHDMSTDKDDKWNHAGRTIGADLWDKLHLVDSSGIGKPGFNVASIGYYGNAQLVKLNDVKEIELAASQITPQNAGKYLYHVVENDSIELVHWTKPSVFRSNKFTSYAYLGKFNTLNKIIKLEFYEEDHYKNRTTLIFNGGYMPPPKLTFLTLNYNNKYLFQPEKQEYIPNSKQKHFSLGSDGLKETVSFKWSDDINHIALEMKNTLQNDMYHVYLKRTIDGKTDTVMVTNSWEINYYSPNPKALISAAYFNKAGEYEVIIKPEMPEDFKHQAKNVSGVIHFTVLPGPVALPLKTVALIILIILTTGGFMFMMYRDQQKRKLKREAQNKQIATLQLASVRAQLNPHFIFNALAGIQNLMNKNEVENANKYLSRFARLTRNVLDDGNKELVTIEHETGLLNDYLQMEQMRFGFNFSIVVDANEVDEQIEIPTMLLQPFAENAVKHGVSAMKDEGMISIGITKKEHTLILTVQDNGKGFSGNQSAGMGMKLCEDRIKLLNSIYKNTTILLHQTSGSKGTTITIELQNWV